MKKVKLFVATLALALSTSASAAFITIGTSTGGIYDVDTATGVATELIAGGIGPFMTDLARDASGNLFGINFSNLYSIDTDNDTFSVVGSLGVGGMNALTFNGATLYGSSYISEGLYTINTGDGSVSRQGTEGSHVSAGDLAFDADGTMYLLANTGADDTLVSVDTVTGSTSAIGSGTGIDGAFGMAFVDSVMYAVSSAGVLYTVDTVAGSLSSPVSISGITGAVYGATISAVPIPATVWLFATGMLGLLGFSRKRQ